MCTESCFLPHYRSFQAAYRAENRRIPLQVSAPSSKNNENKFNREKMREYFIRCNAKGSNARRARPELPEAINVFVKSSCQKRERESAVLFESLRQEEIDGISQGLSQFKAQAHRIKTASGAQKTPTA